MNPYDILGISKDSTPEEIKSKYKSLAQQHHPDKGGDPTTFKEIKEAYELLIDPIRKERYDKTGKFDKHQNFRDEALEHLSRLFLHVVNNINPDHDNLVIIMKNETRNEISVINNNIEVCKNHIKKLEKIIKKIKKKNDGENLLQMFTQNQLNGRLNELHNFYRQIQILELMLRMLEDYQYGELVDLLESSVG
jgi:curved DNA-binding protein CbpA